MSDVPSHIQLHKDDDFVILTARMPAGADVLGVGYLLEKPVPAGHKIALRDLPKGTKLRKFGQIIGEASTDIAKGAHVHSHNCQMAEHEGASEVGSGFEAALAHVPSAMGRVFQGYARADGRVGTRNMIALLATVNCSATVIRKAAEEIERNGVLNRFPNVDGIVALTHGTGCGMPSHGSGWEYLQRVLWGYATHPNIGAAVFVGLGCEVMQIAKMQQMFGGSAEDKARFHGLTIQDTGGTRATINQIVAHVEALLPEVNQISRTKQPLSKLTVGLQCGGSDGYSGITANPALGVASDLIVGEGGTVILSETPEIYGATQLLLDRVSDPTVADTLNARIDWWQSYTEMNGASMDNNPSPGNKAGGLTTILEKSLGAVAKAGSTPLNAVLSYAEKPDQSGLVFMDTPGYDPVSATGQIAGGAQLIVFTTGRGSAFGSKPAPTLKLATNDALFASMRDDMDLNCGDVISAGTSLSDKGAEILELIIAAASGEQTKSEKLGLGDNEFVPWQIGAVM